MTTIKLLCARYKKRILSLFDIKNPLTSTEIIVGMYRLYKTNITRQNVFRIMAYLKQKKVMKKQWGIYTKETTSLNELSALSGVIFDLHDKTDLNGQCNRQICNREKMGLYTPLNDVILFLVKKNKSLTLNQIKKKIFAIYNALPARKTVYYHLNELLNDGSIQLNGYQRYSINPTRKRCHTKRFRIWKGKSEFSAINLPYRKP
ncbi:hypothetical protein AYO45_01860 [Gammaproteobacteria bacterium SCGC AG-212-F23]|nr:hypothetical protein AYO45_01860 [Gammaproteobacteria bacterium SCGC AG-212-F23]